MDNTSGQKPIAAAEESSQQNEAAPAFKRFSAQAVFEAKAILRNGEQLMVTILLPLFLLVLLTKTDIVNLSNPEFSTINYVAPGVIALATMSSSFTSQAIATAFDRRNGVLRLLSTTPLGPNGLLAAKVSGVLLVILVQLAFIVPTALFLGWEPNLSGIWLAVLSVLLGALAFTSLALLLASVLRAEGVLAVANIVLILLIVGGAVLAPASELPNFAQKISLFLPSGALGEAMRGAFIFGDLPDLSLLVLLAWSCWLGWGASRLFRWH